MSAQSLSSLPAKPPATSDAVETEPQGAKPQSTRDEDQRDDSATSNASDSEEPGETASNASAEPPLPNEQAPPLPDGPPPAAVTEDDGWEPVWDENAQAFYFYNRITQVSQWENPRVPEATSSAGNVKDNGPPGAPAASLPRKPVAGGYDPSIHGDYDPNADYAKVHELQHDGLGQDSAAAVDPTSAYAATGAFNRFTGKWQQADLNPDKFSDENKSKRQMNAFFDVDAAANLHDGRSLKAERSGKKISKADLKAYREKRKEKKEERRRAWLRD